MTIFPLYKTMSVDTYKNLGWFVTLLFVIATVIEIVLLIKKKNFPCGKKQEEVVVVEEDIGKKK